MGNIWARVFKTRDVRILICGEYISVYLLKYIRFAYLLCLNIFNLFLLKEVITYILVIINNYSIIFIILLEELLAYLSALFLMMVSSSKKNMTKVEERLLKVLTMTPLKKPLTPSTAYILCTALKNPVYSLSTRFLPCCTINLRLTVSNGWSKIPLKTLRK